MAQTVLIIDDAPDIHLLLDVRLRGEGVRLIHADNGRVGVEKAMVEQPDLILLDVRMPDECGFDICSVLKSFPNTQAIPVIFLSAVSDSVDRVRGLDLGAVDYVTKPFDVAELRARVRAALRTKRYLDMLTERAQIDGLTGLWNRKHFDTRLREMVANSLRYQRPFCLIMLDVDHFKNVNDTYGHPMGDRVLETVGELLTREVRETDIACRYGGEEFGILLSETEPEAGVVLAARLIEHLKQEEFSHQGQAFHVTASVGIAGVGAKGPGASVTVESILRRADQALYRAKDNGRDRVELADTL